VRLPGPRSPNALFQGALGDGFEATCLDSLAALQKQAQIQKAICMVQLPNWADVAISCRRSQGWKIVYDCMDEHSGYTGSKPRNLAREARLIEESDLVVASSRLLFDKAKRQASRAILLPNAADFDHFNAPPAERPLEGLSRPIIGYFGAIAEWFDVDMIKAAAELRRGWHFVLIGDFSRADVAALRRLRNVHLLGELPYRALPAYLHQLDVACIPFRINSLTMATSPVKFYEYLSAGKPVVSVPLPELEQYRGFFYPAQTGVEFVRQVESALSEQSHEKSLARIELARANTWSHRCAQLSEALDSL
jgi:glycosyltransferase involved in cell wall biosynthesis